MVRATFAAYTTALSALQANQKRLDISGQNLSNMNTPGYTRQQLKVSSINYTNPISHYMNDTQAVVGYGVSMDAVTQIRDPYLDAQYRNQIQKSGYTDSIQTALDRLANVFDESQIDGIRKAFADIQTTLTNMQDLGNVNDPIYESELRNRMQALTNLLNSASQDLTKAEQDELRKLDGTGVNEMGDVQNINNILQQIGQLNREIKNGQIAGMDCLELMDERNLLLDELASYVPIEVTYYKDAAHDGIGKDAAGNAVAAPHEEYYLDGHGNIVGRRDWPDDLRVEMIYKDENGDTQKLTLVEGTIGENDDNYGKLKMELKNADGSIWTSDSPTAPQLTKTPPEVSLIFIGIDKYDPVGDTNPSKAPDVKFSSDPANGTITNHFANGSGSVQAKLDMLWKDGLTQGIADVRGYEFYRKQLDTLAQSFAEVMNTLNTTAAGNDQILLTNKTDDSTTGITAENIGISQGWINGSIHIATKDLNGDGNSNDTILNMLEAMKATYPYSNLKDTTGNPLFDNIDLKNNTFADFMNYTSTILANDSYTNAQTLKTNVTVLNGIQNSRDSVSGVSLDEEASNMMMYISAYNAASRLMTTLDEALNTLINNTGLVGR